jgi:hypothetical protein
MKGKMDNVDPSSSAEGGLRRGKRCGRGGRSWNKILITAEGGCATRNLLLSSKDGDDVFYFDYEEAVVAFEIYGDGAFGVEKDFVVLFQGVLGGGFDLGRDGYDAAGDGGDFNVVGQLNAALGLLLVLVFAYQDPLANGFDCFNGFFGFVSHVCNPSGGLRRRAPVTRPACRGVRRFQICLFGLRWA